MIKGLLSDSLLYTISQSLFQGLPILLLPLFLAQLTPEQYGTYELAMIAVVLINLTVSFEVGQGLARHYADAQNDDDKRRIASTALWFTVACYGVFALVVAVLHEPLASLLAMTVAELAAVAAAAVCFGVFLLLQNQLRWDMRSKRYFAASLIYTTSFVIVVACGLLVAELGWVSLFLAQALASILAGGVAFGLTSRRYAVLFDRQILTEMLRFSLPLIPSGLFIWVNASLDRIILESFLGLAAVGLYGAAFRIASTINFFLVGLHGALTPHIYRNFRDPAFPAQTARVFCWVAWLLLAVVLVFALLATEVFAVVAPQEYAPAAALLGMLALSSVLSRLYIFAPGLDIAKKTWRIALINGSACLVNVGLNFWLIPIYGPAGAAMGTVASSVLMFGLYLYQSQKHYPLPYPWGRLGLVVVLFLAIILANQLMGSGLSNASSFLARFAMLLCFAFGAKAILRLSLRFKAQTAPAAL